MLDLFLAFLRIRTLIILGILYFFLSVGSHGNFSLKIPSLKNFDLSNIPASINSLINDKSNLKSETKTSDNSGNNNELDDLKTSVNDIAKNINNILNKKE
ncbi:hypothetical protein [Candidatus Aquarickettsia rohweri]|uniref:Uncharacterized protein n=1 Tax=Candidatus Aquarickettsia rohweri TaxID=2602574 RepID=A0A3R9XSK3_9RICK|nr:hypothetical protein [Candidatus Aquarickettsia rohweri]RST70340.1 hypothetical protein EIC27_01440 [Candidatus Aquarickettsia rohweri]